MKHPSGYALIRRHLRRYPRILRQHLLRELSRLVAYEPVIGIMGKTGVGKSSLCNALFRSEVCAVNAVEACTRQRPPNALFQSFTISAFHCAFRPAAVGCNTCCHDCSSG